MSELSENMQQEKLEQALADKVAELLEQFGAEIPDGGFLSITTWHDTAIIAIRRPWPDNRPPVQYLYLKNDSGVWEVEHLEDA